MEKIEEKVELAQITVTYKTDRGRGSNGFHNLKDLKTWLDKHPAIAEKLGYVPKEKQNKH